jgi:hypothetical protein
MRNLVQCEVGFEHCRCDFRVTSGADRIVGVIPVASVGKGGPGVTGHVSPLLQIRNFSFLHRLGIPVEGNCSILTTFCSFLVMSLLRHGNSRSPIQAQWSSNELKMPYRLPETVGLQSCDHVPVIFPHDRSLGLVKVGHFSHNIGNLRDAGRSFARHCVGFMRASLAARLLYMGDDWERTLPRL